ncbi:3222_t:CDS:2, partial [Scutellospora calospora]
MEEPNYVNANDIALEKSSTTSTSELDHYIMSEPAKEDMLVILFQELVIVFIPRQQEYVSALKVGLVIEWVKLNKITDYSKL